MSVFPGLAWSWFYWLTLQHTDYKTDDNFLDTVHFVRSYAVLVLVGVVMDDGPAIMLQMTKLVH